MAFHGKLIYELIENYQLILNSLWMQKLMHYQLIHNSCVIDNLQFPLSFIGLLIITQNMLMDRFLTFDGSRIMGVAHDHDQAMVSGAGSGSWGFWSQRHLGSLGFSALRLWPWPARVWPSQAMAWS